MVKSSNHFVLSKRHVWESDHCLEELYKKQMVNIKIYKGGMEDFEKRFKKIKIEI